MVPDELHETVIHEAHSSPCMGLFGVKKTFDRVAPEYYWPEYYYDIADFIRKSQEYKLPWQEQRILMVLKFPPSKSQNKYLIVFQDLFTRWVELKPVRSADGKMIVKAFKELILFRWETPDYLLTDNGKEFDKYLNQQFVS